MVVFIPLGIDCGLAGLLQKSSLRTCAFPFDWNVTYMGISNIFKDNFDNFIPDNSIIINTKPGNKYHMSFPHNEFPRDSDKYTRRIQRLLTLLESSNEHIILFRRSHSCDHHTEHTDIKNDINDIEELDILFKTRYPNLKYTFIISLACSKCYNPNIIYKSQSNTIDIYNIVAPKDINDEKFNDLYNTVINKYI